MQISIPYTHALTKGRIVRGEVTNVTDKSVQLRDGQVFAFDYLIIASGTSFRGPAKYAGDDMKSALRSFTRSRTLISAANHITIVGGGAVGLELAGEISSGVCFGLKLLCKWVLSGTTH